VKDNDAAAGSAADANEQAAETPTRLCPRCSALSRTEGDFCPHCGGSFLHPSRQGRLGRRGKLALLTVVVVLALAGGGTAFALKHNHDAAHERQTAAAAAQQAETKAQIAQRHVAEREMQGAITTWARKQVGSGTLDGPILRTSCTPIGGGSENLAEVTVKYDCLAIDKDSQDGTSTGYSVHATMDFFTGTYQWGLGGG
jgi:hypothetical protein